MSDLGGERATMSVMTDDYFAGLFDGEGSLRISSNGKQYQLLASLGMTDLRPVSAMRERFGGWIEERTNEGTVWKPVHIWRAASGPTMALLDAIEDKLLVKGEQAHIAREFQQVLQERTPRDDPRKRALYERMREANRRGR
jgi:hypothetical protein